MHHKVTALNIVMPTVAPAKLPRAVTNASKDDDEQQRKLAGEGDSRDHGDDDCEQSKLGDNQGP